MVMVMEVVVVVVMRGDGMNGGSDAMVETVVM